MNTEDQRRVATKRKLVPALILDRDGVITENRENYIRSWADVAFCEGSLDAMAALAQLEHKIAIVSNQSVVGRGLMSLSATLDLNQRILQTVVDHGGRIDKSYICPHHPEAGCSCRKPRPGLVLQAADELDLDLGRSILIGDALSDLEAGARAGVARLVLVRTGRGSVQEAAVRASHLREPEIFDNLLEATRALFPSVP